MTNTAVKPNIKNFITWFQDEKIKIQLSEKPYLTTLQYPPNATEEEIAAIDEKPYILLHGLWVRVTYKGIIHYFYIPKGYRWNGANVPAGLWLLVANPDDPKLRLASMIHDWLCENHADINYNRYLSTLIFCSLCRVSGVSNWRINLIFFGLNTYQKIFGQWEKAESQDHTPLY